MCSFFDFIFRSPILIINGRHSKWSLINPLSDIQSFSNNNIFDQGFFWSGPRKVLHMILCLEIKNIWNRAHNEWLAFGWFKDSFLPSWNNLRKIPVSQMVSHKYSRRYFFIESLSLTFRRQCTMFLVRCILRMCACVCVCKVLSRNDGRLKRQKDWNEFANKHYKHYDKFKKKRVCHLKKMAEVSVICYISLDKKHLKPDINSF